jgi:thioredoxin
VTVTGRTGLRAAACAALLAAAACGGATRTAPQADMKIITHGQKVDLAANLAPGKYTVVDFYASWCPPCRLLGPALERLAAAENSRLALRKVDIVDWTMPVVDQYGIEALPHLKLFGPDGKQVADGDAVFPSLLTIFGEAAREVGETGAAIGSTAPPEKEGGVL